MITRWVDARCAPHAPRIPAVAPEVVAERVVERLQTLSETMHELPPKVIRKLLQVFVGRLEVDLETREIEVEFRLPSWV